MSAARLKPVWIGRELYIGKIFAGEVSRAMSENWRDGISRANYLYDLYAKYETKPWRAFVMTCPDGDKVGDYETEDEAMAALLITVVSAMLPETEKPK